MPCCSEMLKFSRNKKKYKNVRGPPEHSAIGLVHRDILLMGIITIGVRDQFRLGGLRSVARIFPPLLARKST